MLRVATLNCWALPLGLARHTDERLAALVERLPALPVDAIALQEVWTPEARARLVAAGRRGGFADVLDASDDETLGGLLVLSRLPVARAAFHPYTLRGVALHVHRGDYQGRKGFLTADVETAAGPVRLLATHLHARYTADDPYEAHRVGQVFELAHALRDTRLPVVALGDFNLRESGEGYRLLRRLSWLRDVAAELGARQPTVRRASPYRGAGHRGDERIDYVFARNGDGVAVRPVRIARAFDERLTLAGEPAALSDHDGLTATLALTARAARPAVYSAPPSREALMRVTAILDEGRRAARERLVRHAGLAAGSGVAVGAALVASRHPVLGRRRFLRLAALGSAFCALPAPVALAASAAHYVPEEIEAFDLVRARAQRWRAQSTAAPAASAQQGRQ